MVKYSRMLSCHESNFNELYKMHKAQDVNLPMKNLQMWLVWMRIGHYIVKFQCPDGKYGWDSHCLNKDLYELEKFGGSSLIKFIRELNAEHRS